jgi:nicotinamidase/pyrazinamidase
MTATTLLLVDVQRDFHPGGSLAIPNADEDADRIAELIRAHGSQISRIVATMDSHHKLHIAHPGFWLSSEGKQPDPFTIISLQDIQDGKWKPRDSLRLPSDVLDSTVFSGMDQVLKEDGSIDLLKYSIEYAKRLEEKGRFQICVWPEHCLIGSPGHCVVDVVRQAMDEWCVSTGGTIEWVLKGQNLLTEMYSALEADVPTTQSTSFNKELQTSMETSDRLLVCGQAMSHCVNYTLRDIVSHWPKEEMSKISLLTDCTSAVPGFEAAAETFRKDMRVVGVVLQTAAEAFSGR